MNLRCALCSRPLSFAAVFIGEYPVGPVCARRAGLTALAAKGNSKVLRLGAGPHAARARDVSLQMPLDLEAIEE